MKAGVFSIIPHTAEVGLTDLKARFFYRFDAVRSYGNECKMHENRVKRSAYWRR